ncbi:MAG: hypothetical protein ABIG44_07110 [Planctomycetota bacterium]
MTLSRWTWSLGTWLAARRRPRVQSLHVRRQVFRTQLRGMGVRWNEWLRDRLRTGWLRLRRSPEKNR